MNTFLTKLKQSLKEQRNRMAQAIAELPPGDQLVVEGPVKSLISDQSWFLNRIDEMADMLSDDEMIETAQEEVIASLLTEGKIVKQEEIPGLLAKEIEDKKLVDPDKVEAQINAAREEEKEAAKERVQNLELIASRRAEAVEQHGQAVMAMKDEDFLADDFADRLGLFAGRLEKLQEVGVDPAKDRETVEVFCSHPLDEEGEKTFSQMLKVSLAASKSKQGEGGERGEEGEGGGAPGASRGASRSVMAGALDRGEGEGGSPAPKKAKLYL